MNESNKKADFHVWLLTKLAFAGLILMFWFLEDINSSERVLSLSIDEIFQQYKDVSIGLVFLVWIGLQIAAGMFNDIVDLLGKMIAPDKPKESPA